MRWFVCLLLSVYSIILLARILLEWFPVSSDHPVATVRRYLRAATDPVLIPVRRLLPPVQAGGVGLDLSPLVVFAAIWVLRIVIC